MRYILFLLSSFILRTNIYAGGCLSRNARVHAAPSSPISIPSYVDNSLTPVVPVFSFEAFGEPAEMTTNIVDSNPQRNNVVSFYDSLEVSAPRESIEEERSVTFPLSKRIEYVAEAGVHINVYPVPTEYTDVGQSEVTIGDLHGSAQKMLHFLLKEGVLTLPKENWRRFVQLYQANPRFQAIKFASLYELKGLISHLERAPCADLKVRFIGDTLCDRGKNDAITLLIYNKMHELNIDYEVLLSNHDMIFLSTLEGGKLAEEKMSPGYPSLAALYESLYPETKECIAEELEERSRFKEELNGIIQKAYLPYLKLVSYSNRVSTDDQEAKEKLVIYTHAPILNLAVVYALDKAFSSDQEEKEAGSDESAMDHLFLKEMIMRINKRFQDWLFDKRKEEEVSKIWKAVNTHQKEVEAHWDTNQVITNILSSKDLPALFWQLTWHKGFGSSDSRHERPHIIFVHGHNHEYSEDFKTYDKNIINLDRGNDLHFPELGKQSFVYTQSYYIVLRIIAPGGL